MAIGTLTDKKIYLNPDIYMAVGIMAIIAIMVLPITPVVIDLLIATNLVVTLLVLFISLYTIEPLDFSTFPSLLLLTTLYRLALNVASTRLILLDGNSGKNAAGYVIQAFGESMIGGNYIIGIIVFLILILINFLVITKGAGRIAEVTARFALDAMPGKQMAIDADLNAGIIDDKTAQERRKKVQRESDFFGAMDGASKFVRGDAIAGIIITMINIIGGLIIGVTVHGMNIASATANYTILTIGDGLVSQIPALIISTAAGITVSKAGRENKLGTDFGMQIFGNHRAMIMVAIISCSFLFVPGVPKLPFVSLGFLFGFLGWRNYKKLQQQQQEKVERQEQAKISDKKTNEEEVAELLPINPLSIELGYGLIPLVDPDQDGELLERIKAIRRQLAMELGFIVPSVLIKDNLQLPAGGYSIVVKGVEVAKGEMRTGSYLCMQTDEPAGEIAGEPTTEPAFGLPALWISEKDRDEAERAGYTVVDIPTIITTHLTEVIKNRAYEFLTRNDLQKILDQLSQRDPKLVEELIPGVMNLGQTQRVLQLLLREMVSIRDMVTIMETLSEFGPVTKNTEVLAEYCRQALAKNISRQYVNQEGNIPVITLHPTVEKLLIDNMQDTGQGTFIGIDPDSAEEIINKIKDKIPFFQQFNYQPIILTHPQIRPHLKKMTSRAIPGLVVLSTAEISSDIHIDNLAVVEMIYE